ncbi:MAG: hypothetical protein WAM70_16710, partial [Pyrinomonadaceae bacterium]
VSLRVHSRLCLFALRRKMHRGRLRYDPSAAFVYGVFIDKATNIADGTVGAAARALFRDQIASALKTWKDCPNVMNPMRPIR